jgi:hypothetical protein
MEPKKRSMIWVVAPTMDLADKVHREAVIVVAEHLRHRIVELKQHDKRIILRNLGGGISEIRGKTADNPVSLLGEGCDLIIVDEASRMKPMVWTSFLSQRLIDRDGSALLISTPKGRGWFWDMWRRGQPGGDPQYESWNAPSWQNPHLNRELIEAERERLPQRVFDQELGGQFIEGAGSVLRFVREAATGEWQAPVPGQSYYAGLDLAKIEDFTVLVIMNQQRQVVFVDRFHRLDWSLQVTRIQAALKRYNDAIVLVDSTGAGEPIYEALREANCYADAYSFTARSKADLINNLSLMFEQRQITLPRVELCPEMIDECEAYEYSITENGSVRTGAPGGMHDDLVIALGLAAMNVGPDGATFEVQFV